MLNYTLRPIVNHYKTQNNLQVNIKKALPPSTPSKSTEKKTHVNEIHLPAKQNTNHVQNFLLLKVLGRDYGNAKETETIKYNKVTSPPFKFL